MIKQLATWKFTRKSVVQNIPVMILYVLDSEGSSPGRRGFCMAVNAEKKMEGSIGGGIMEHKFVEMAVREIRNKPARTTRSDGKVQISPPALPGRAGNKEVGEIKRQVHDKTTTKDQSGMICSGEQTILLYPVQEKDIIHIDRLISSLEQNKNGTLHLSASGILFEDSLPDKDFEFKFIDEKDWCYYESTGYRDHLYIIGGGHCSLAFSRLMSTMNFYIHLFEHRDGLNTLEANTYAHEKTIIDDYAELPNLIPSGKSYVVIMTFGYRTDDIALRALLDKDLKYLGLLGSKNKIEKMFATYKSEGIDEDVLKKIHSPVGIQIKSETPEEIAVSIAAEIIKVKNEVSNRQNMKI